MLKDAACKAFVETFFAEHAAALGALPLGEGGWSLGDHLSADFAYFLHGASIEGSAPPLLSVSAVELTPLAQRCLGKLGVALTVDDRALVDRCLPLLLRAGEGAELELFARTYGALGPCEGLLYV